MLVSAGGTREPIDAVRFVGNRSSGRMGVALAAEARRRGADVTLLASNLAVPPPAGVEVVQAPTAADVEREALARADADVDRDGRRRRRLPSRADARDDKRPKGSTSPGRSSSSRPPTSPGRSASGRTAASSSRSAPSTARQGLERKRAMLDGKNADLVVYNDVGRSDIGFDTDENEVVLVTRAGDRHVPKAPKQAIAAADPRRGRAPPGVHG